MLTFEQYSDVVLKDCARRSEPIPTEAELRIIYRRHIAGMRYAWLMAAPAIPSCEESELKYIESELAECDRLTNALKC